MKKGILAGAAAAAAVPVSILTAKTIALKKPLPSGESVISYTPDEEKKYASLLSEMIKVPTVSVKEGENYDDFLKFRERLSELFPLVFTKLEKHYLNGNILLLWKGSKSTGNGGSLLMGHQDVVPVDQAGWTKDPFSGEIENGIIWGRGAMDCKSTLCCEMQAVEELLEEGFVPEKDIWLFASCNEEISGGGVEAAAQYFKDRGIKLDSVMDEGGAVVDGIFPGLKAPCSAVGVVEKGFVNIKFTAKGSGGHASTPSRHSPIARLADFVSEVDRKSLFTREYITPVPEMFSTVAPYLPFPLRMVLGNMNVFGGLVKKVLPAVSSQAGAFIATTAAFTMSGGSTAPNVLPDEAYVICNVRPSVHQNADESVAVLKKIADRHGIETEVLYKKNASNTTPVDSDEFRYLTACIEKCLPDTIPVPYLMTGGTDSRTFEPVCDNVLRFTPTRLTGEQLAAMHAANENINSSAIAEGVKFYKYYLTYKNKGDK